MTPILLTWNLPAKKAAKTTKTTKTAKTTKATAAKKTIRKKTEEA